jgi:hypothetical protein
METFRVLRLKDVGALLHVRVLAVDYVQGHSRPCDLHMKQMALQCNAAHMKHSFEC